MKNHDFTPTNHVFSNFRGGGRQSPGTGKLYNLVPNPIVDIDNKIIIVLFQKMSYPEHLSSPSVFNGVRVTGSLVLCVCFVDRCLSFCPFSFGHCVVCSSSIYGF